MRIISGQAKGLKLTPPPSKSIFLRPTSDRSREALFSILGSKVVGCNLLDLYAGTGALGLEAISRGAKSAIFVDNNHTSIKILKSNISSVINSLRNLDDPPTIRLKKFDLRNDIPSLFQDLNIYQEKFDLVFIDPPYDKGFALATSEQLTQSSLLSEEGLIIIEERAKTDFPENINSFHLVDKRTYGDTGFWIFSR